LKYPLQFTEHTGVIHDGTLSLYINPQFILLHWKCWEFLQFILWIEQERNSD